MEDSLIEIEYSTFINNEGILGGAVYTLGDYRILQTYFINNMAVAAVRRAYLESYAFSIV